MFGMKEQHKPLCHDYNAPSQTEEGNIKSSSSIVSDCTTWKKRSECFLLPPLSHSKAEKSVEFFCVGLEIE